MGFFKNIFTAGRLRDSDKNGIPDHQETNHNDRNNNGLLDHLEGSSIDTNQDGLGDTEIRVNSDPFSRQDHLQKSKDVFNDQNNNGQNDIYELDQNDQNDNGMFDYEEDSMDTDGDGWDDLDVDII